LWHPLDGFSTWPGRPQRNHAAVRVGRSARDGREEVPPDAGGEEYVTQADDVRQDRHGDGQDVADRPAGSQERPAQFGRKRSVERRRQVGRREAGHLDRRHEHGHVPSVEEDGDAVGGDPDHGQKQAGLCAIEPQRHHEQAEGEGEEWCSELVDDVNALVDEPLGGDA
jgi:hypothetical protein